MRRLNAARTTSLRRLRRPAHAPERLEPRYLYSAGWDVVLVDSTLDDAATFAAAVPASDHARVVVYDGHGQSASAVLDAVVDWSRATGNTLHSISLLSHAGPGRFALGDEIVSAENLPDTAPAWQRLGGVMDAGAHLSLYGCDLAGSVGSTPGVIDALARLTGATVYASTNPTGRGGDWSLEVASSGDAPVSSDGPSDFPAGVFASWGGTLTLPLTGELPVNTTTSGTQQTSIGSQKAVAVDAGGDFVVAWSGAGSGDASGIFARRYDAAGNPLGAEFLVNTTTAGVQHEAAVATDAAGNFVVVWASAGQDGSGYGVYAQRYTAAGAAAGGQVHVSVTTAGDQSQPSVAMDSDGDFVVSWTSPGQDTGGLAVVARRFNASGVAQGGEFVVNSTYTDFDQQYSRVAIDAAGDFVIAWQSYVAATTSTGIYARRYNAAGTPLSEFLVNTATTGDQSHPSIGMNASGAFVVAWTSFGQDGSAPASGGVYAQRYTAAGAAAGGEFRVSVATAGDQTYPSVAVDAGGAFAVAWQSAAQDGSGWGVYSRDYTAAGAPRSGDNRLSVTTAADQSTVSLAAVPSTGDYVAVWSGNGAGDADGVFARAFRPTSPGITVTPTGGLATTEAGGTATFTVVLDSAPTANVTVDLSTSDATEGAASTAQLVFTPANWDTPQTVTVTGADDAFDDGNIGYGIITAAVSSDLNYSGLNPADVALSNTDDDTASIVVSAASGPATTEAGATVSFTVVLTAAPTAAVTIGVSSSDTTEGTVSSAVLTFTGANWNVPQTVTITGVNDAFDDGDVAYTILTAAAVSADAAYSGINPADVSVANTDDDTAGILVSPTSGLVTTEAGATASFNVVLTAAPTSTVTIGVASSDATEGSVSAATLTFNSGNWNVPQTVTVSGVDDAVHDGTVAYTIVTAAASSADPAFNGLNPADVSAANTDNDPGGVTVTPTSGLTTTEAGTAATFTIVLTTAPFADVTIGLASSNTAEGTVSAPSLTFTPANWNVPQTVTVTGVDDGAADGPVAYAVVTAAATSADAGYNGLSIPDVSLTSGDDDSGLKARYYDNVNFTGFSVTRIDPVVDFNWAAGSPDPAIGADTFSARWTGEIRPRYGETYTFHTTSDDGVRLWVNGTLVIDNWTNHSSTVDTGTIVLAADQWYSIRMEVFENTGVALAKLEWSSASQAREVVPFGRLRPTNNAPAASDDGYAAAQGGALVVGSASGLLANDVDADADPLTASLVTGPTHGTLTLNADGSFTYTPAATFFGTDAFTYRAGDGLAASGVATVTLNVARTAGVVISPTSGLTTTDSGGAAAFDVVLEGPPTAPVMISFISGAPQQGTLSQSILVFDASNWNVPQTVTVTGADDSAAGGSVAYTITGTVSSADPRYDGLALPPVNVTNNEVVVTPPPVPQSPVAADDAYQVTQDGELTVPFSAGVLANDADPAGAGVAAVVVRAPAHGSLALRSDGGFSYTPDAGFFGLDDFEYAAVASGVSSAPARVTIVVQPAGPAAEPPPPGPGPVPPAPPVETPPSNPVVVQQPALPQVPEPETPAKKPDAEVVVVPPAAPPAGPSARPTPPGPDPQVPPLPEAGTTGPDLRPNSDPQDGPTGVGGERPVAAVTGDPVVKPNVRPPAGPEVPPEPGDGLPIVHVASASLSMGLDAMARQIGSRGSAESASVQAVRHTFVAITVGYVVWSLRGASLVASFLTSIPLWRSLDPLPILENRKRGKNKKRRGWLRRGGSGGGEQPLGEMVK